jgi:hypothetical protein
MRLLNSVCQSLYRIIVPYSDWLTNDRSYARPHKLQSWIVVVIRSLRIRSCFFVRFTLHPHSYQREREREREACCCSSSCCCCYCASPTVGLCHLVGIGDLGARRGNLWLDYCQLLARYVAVERSNEDSRCIGSWRWYGVKQHDIADCPQSVLTAIAHCTLRMCATM